LVLVVITYLLTNLQDNLAKQNIASGLDFLIREAGFEIGESTIEYFSDDTYKRALLVGLINTLKVAFFGNIFAIVLGIIAGVCLTSSNWLLSKITKAYVEVVRNTPLLLQLFFFYSIFTEIFPSVRQALNPVEGVFLSNRGLHIPWFEFSNGLSISWPKLQGFNFRGGYNLTPEFSTLLLGLVIYTGAFIAVIVKTGIASVNKGQSDASLSLGLSSFQTLRFVILPQALRVIIPPTTSQLLNLTKNSSLAVAIGYPDFVSVANTSMNQTGQAVELVSIIVIVYLIFSLLTSFFMNLYNKKMAIKER
jgi:general L-amino acid transport system permease protein